ncbi:hypothetical protein GCM10010320_56140 [Streptomyces caelestis]|jgi:GH25 family lysozyme M1 (1,4-beta-N-acetylmuramidase)|uniref:GH25 family lysozyme M1 (1,4-beta-N-acetylmuramidase) n=1 Tax=Streptomyces caelestis TaxID=36816 RepID=A0A7W9H8F8_9ACTN|nr:GH25 family lysozyme M1 (1,4-beta-N-acetylmuramidase) [Streptomyces caelestis]GGW67692.1 hypothetical protein GCM10010320_56140 [Streptomyces caelestis]
MAAPRLGSAVSPGSSPSASRASSASYDAAWTLSPRAAAASSSAWAPDRPGDILALGWETTSDGTYASNAEKDLFLRKLKDLRPNNQVVLYCNRNFLLNHDTTSYAGDALWIADYVSAG